MLVNNSGSIATNNKEIDKGLSMFNQCESVKHVLIIEGDPDPVNDSGSTG
ncbi:Uncharacterised protein [Serratia odorifera]|uniref:Uncharacterized protein n=1 Tax=Serratia odorifera TaxID=618 RepID=A0A447KRJ9_SEROD|nr:Uncharacterised protein [Serratia plymuthica]CAI1820232.1 Uncharacterised protein [Serratia quinivorans]VDZ57736.1 Uncharacterised protein [Serratia odorifera]